MAMAVYQLLTDLDFIHFQGIYNNYYLSTKNHLELIRTKSLTSTVHTVNGFLEPKFETLPSLPKYPIASSR